LDLEEFSFQVTAFFTGMQKTLARFFKPYELVYTCNKVHGLIVRILVADCFHFRFVFKSGDMLVAFLLMMRFL
jgi:hypothetical protein